MTSPKPEIVVGGVPEHFNLPWHMALSPEGLRDLPVRARWRDFPGGTGDMCRALASGEIDLAVLLTEGIVKHIDGGGGARIVGTYTRSPLIWGIHVSASGPTSGVEDLRGARYAVSRHGSGSQLMAELDAAQRGWPAPELVVVGDLQGGRAALQEGRADAFMWEKTMSLPLVQSGEWRRVGEFAGPWPAFVIAASERRLSGGVTWLPALCAHVAAACDLAAADRSATASFIGNSYHIPSRDILAWLDATEWQCEARIAESVLATVSATLSHAGIIGAGVPARALVDTPERLY